jgi:hypothetical protein
MSIGHLYNNNNNNNSSSSRRLYKFVRNIFHTIGIARLLLQVKAIAYGTTSIGISMVGGMI